MPHIEQIERHLAEAERHVATGERLLAQQRSTIEERRRDGHDVALAIDLLAQLELAQRHHVEELERLRLELLDVERALADPHDADA
jgi:hypothetical protein